MEFLFYKHFLVKKQLLIAAFLLIGVFLWFYFFKEKSHSELFKVMNVPEFEMVNQENKSISSKDMLGKVFVVEFFFTNCPTICPVMNQNLIELESKINSPDFGVLSITIDPKRDNVEKLKFHKDHLKIKNPNWHFLTADRDYILNVSKKFNIYMGTDENSAEGLEHSGKMALVDKKGKIRSRYNSHGIPILYYSGLNYSDPEGKESSLKGEFHPEINWLEVDIKILLNE